MTTTTTAYLTFVPDVASVLSVFLFDDGLQVVVNFRSHFHGLFEIGRSDGKNHKLLHGQFVSGVTAAVDDVEGRHGQDDVIVAGQVGDVAIERDALLGGAGLADGQGDAEDSVGAELGLVFRSVEFQHESIDAGLIRFVKVLRDQSRADRAVDVLHGFENA